MSGEFYGPGGPAYTPDDADGTPPEAPQTAVPASGHDDSEPDASQAEDAEPDASQARVPGARGRRARR